MGKAICKLSEDPEVGEQMDLEHSGGNRKRRLSEETSSNEKNDANGESNHTTEENTVNAPTSEESELKKTKKKSRSKENVALDMTWICTECREAECATQESPLLLCEGPCGRPFHFPCAGLAALPSNDEEWICADCTAGRFQCAVCHEYGAEQTDVHKCEKQECGLFYHESCLNMYTVDVKVTEISCHLDEGESSSVHEHAGPLTTITVPTFVCPAHHCWVCADGMPPRCNENNEADKQETESPAKKEGKKSKRKKGSDALAASFRVKNEQLLRCLDCPNAYHLSCIPPHAAFHELALLCHEHATTSKLPYLNAKESLQAGVEDRTDALMRQFSNKKDQKPGKKLIKRLDGENKWLQGLKGDGLSKYERQLGNLFEESGDPAISMFGKGKSLGFCAPCSIQKEVHSKPPIYSHVHSNQYDAKHRPKRHPPSTECCQCKAKEEDGVICDEHCMNRMLGIECAGNGNNKSGQKNPNWNCNNGQDCGNRVLGRRQFAKCKPKREQGKGWGLASIDGVKKGGLIQEYAGEIIDEGTKRARLHAWAEEHPNDPNFYIMSLEPGWYIDAREKGNLSRFINHSCGPNCHLTPVNVGGHTRVAIVAKRDIQPGEFLCYDYQFDTKDSDKFVCRCGAANCRGTMKGGPSAIEEDDKKKTKKDIWTEAKTKLDKDKKFLEDLEKEQGERLRQVGSSLPGEIGEGARAVASLPTAEFRSKGVCLWRNTTTGADFASRYVRLNEKKESTGERDLSKIDVLSKIKS